LVSGGKVPFITKRRLERVRLFDSITALLKTLKTASETTLGPDLETYTGEIRDIRGYGIVRPNTFWP